MDVALFLLLKVAEQLFEQNTFLFDGVVSKGRVQFLHFLVMIILI